MNNFDIGTSADKEIQEACKIGGDFLLIDHLPEYAEGQKELVTSLDQAEDVINRLHKVMRAAFSGEVVPKMVIGFKIIK